MFGVNCPKGIIIIIIISSAKHDYRQTAGSLASDKSRDALQCLYQCQHRNTTDRAEISTRRQNTRNKTSHFKNLHSFQTPTETCLRCFPRRKLTSLVNSCTVNAHKSIDKQMGFDRKSRSRFSFWYIPPLHYKRASCCSLTVTLVHQRWLLMTFQ